MSELEAARLLLAGLDILAERLPIESQAHSWYVSERARMVEEIKTMESDAPPWEPEPAPSVELPWSAVLCGDSVQAPNGTWYPVDSWSRIGEAVIAILKLPTGGTTKTTRTATDRVTVRRGPAGQATDIFRAGGLDLTPIESGVAA